MKFEKMNFIEHAEKSAEHEYFNYNGEAYYGYQGQDYYGYQGGGQPMAVAPMNPLDRTLVLQIQNTSGSAQTIRIWDSFFGDSTTNTTVTLQNSNTSYSALREQLKSEPLFIRGIKYDVTAASQFSNIITVGNRSGRGGLTQFDWVPRSFRSAQNNINTLIEDYSFTAQLTGSTFWQFTINNSETIVFTLFATSQFNSAQTLRGESAISATNVGAPTGLAPQVVVPVRGSM